MVQFEFMKIAFYIWLLVIMGVGCVFSLLCNKYHKYPFTSAWLCGEVGLGFLYYSLLRAELKVSARWDSHPEALGKNPLPDSSGCWLDGGCCGCRTWVLFPAGCQAGATLIF